MHCSNLVILSLSLFTLAGIACDAAPTDSTMSRGQELATELLERNPDLAVLSLDDERIVAADDEGECVDIDAATYCVAGRGSDASAPFDLSAREPDPEELGATCVIIDYYLYCDVGYGGGGGGGCEPVDCGPCRPRATSSTGYAEWCGCLGWVECYPDDAP